MHTAGAALLLLATLFDDPAQLLTRCFLHDGLNLFSLLDRLGLSFLLVETEPAAHIFDDLSQARKRGRS